MSKNTSSRTAFYLFGMSKILPFLELIGFEAYRGGKNLHSYKDKNGKELHDWMWKNGNNRYNKSKNK